MGALSALIIGGLFASITGSDAFVCLVVAVAGGLVVSDILERREREREIRKFATRMRLTYIGSALPKSFPLHRTSSRTAHSMCNVVAGDRGAAEIVLFDCALRYGRSRFRRTVAAVRGRAGGFGIARFAPDLETEQIGEWMVVYSSRSRLSVEEMQTLISELCAF